MRDDGTYGRACERRPAAVQLEVPVLVRLSSVTPSGDDGCNDRDDAEKDPGQGERGCQVLGVGEVGGGVDEGVARLVEVDIIVLQPVELVHQFCARGETKTAKNKIEGANT